MLELLLWNVIGGERVEMKFYLDGDVEYPTICGTGTEDYFGGAWSYAGFKMEIQEQNFVLRL